MGLLLRALALALLLAACLAAETDAAVRVHLTKEGHLSRLQQHNDGNKKPDEDHEFRSATNAAPAPSAAATGCDPLTAYEACNMAPITGKITNHGGPVITAQYNVYVIFYGAWSTAQQTIVTDFLSGFGATAYYALLRLYGVNGGLVLAKAVTDCYSQGRALNDRLVTSLITAHVTTLADLPVDSNGLYLILTDPTVTHPSLQSACGWHYYVTVQGTRLPYAYIQNPLYRLDGCACYNHHSSPNGDVGVDGLINPMAHEIVESASDPYGTTWYDGKGYENADKCAYSFGTPYQTASGAWANIHIGQRDFLIQRNWNPVTSTCVMG